jgi:hypothetical protein
MNYYDAARIRKKGFANLMTDRLASGQGIVSSLRGTLSDRSKARSMAMKEKFDPMNIAKFLTGGSKLAPAIVGRLMGRSKEDIGYFTGKRQYQYTPRQSSYYEKFKPSMSGGSRKATEVLEKIVSFMEKSREDDIKEQDTLDSYNELNEYIKQDNHKEVMNVFVEAIKNKRKAMKEMAKEAKKRQAQEKAEKKKQETPKQEATKSEIPKTKQETPKQETPKTKTEAPTTAKPIETAPPAPPTATPAPPVTTPKLPMVKPATVEAAKTAAKIVTGVVGVEAISAAAALSIERETGKPAKDAIKNVGQIVRNDPKSGVSSYGVFGINSGGSVQSFIKDNPQFELNAKPASKEFDEQWTKISKEQPQKMLEAQLKWYDKNITVPLKNDLNKIVPTQFANDPRVLTYISDRRIQYGKTMEKKALSHASPAKTVEEFLSLISEYDLANLKDAFKTYLSNHPDNIKGLEKRIREREKVSLKVVANDSNVGDKLNNYSKENTDMKKDAVSQAGATTSPIVIQNNTTNKQRNVEVNSPPLQELNPRIGH